MQPNTLDNLSINIIISTTHEFLLIPWDLNKLKLNQMVLDHYYRRINYGLKIILFILFCNLILVELAI